jgi:GT2 family glycosyltransferase
MTLNALASNYEASESILYIFSDGPPIGSNESLNNQIAETRKIINAENRFKKVIVTERKINIGLAHSIIEGVSILLNENDSIIVLEDDIVTSIHFLNFMNESLNLYKNENKVASICGYWYPISDNLPSTFFLKTESSWGWATWARAWKHFEPDGLKTYKQIRKQKLQKDFDIEGTVAYTKMLKQQINGENNGL